MTKTKGGKRNKPEHNSPLNEDKQKVKKPKAYAKDDDNGEFDEDQDNNPEVILCVSCNEQIDEWSILCNCCQNWEHHQCAGISKDEFGVLTKSSANIMFFCKSCQPKVSLSLKFFNDIQEQQSVINSRIEKLEEQVSKLVVNTQHSRPVQPENSEVAHAVNDPQTSSSRDRKASVNSERNFNIVIFGIEESPPQTSRFDR